MGLWVHFCVVSVGVMVIGVHARCCGLWIMGSGFRVVCCVVKGFGVRCYGDRVVGHGCVVMGSRCYGCRLRGSWILGCGFRV